MTSGTQTTVYFVCPSCRLPYRATQRLRPERLSGSFKCVECRKPIHERTGCYDHFNWQAATMKPASQLDRLYQRVIVQAVGLNAA
jgi:hypothetical protein